MESQAFGVSDSVVCDDGAKWDRSGPYYGTMRVTTLSGGEVILSGAGTTRIGKARLESFGARWDEKRKGWIVPTASLASITRLGARAGVSIKEL